MLAVRRRMRSEVPKEISSLLLTEAVKVAVGNPKKGWKMLQKAIRAHPDMNARDPAGFTALVHAARFNLPVVIHELAGAGANVNLRSDDGNTPFHYACFREHWKAMAMLVQLGADPDAMDTNGRTPLIRAIECQDEELVARLLEFGASAEACGEDDVRPLFAALSMTWPVSSRQTSLSLVRRLLDAGCDVNACNQNGISPLTFVCLQRGYSTELIKLLLDRGASVNALDPDGRTPLIHCLRTDVCSSDDCLMMLLKSGADPNVVDNSGHTPLSIWALDLINTLTYGQGSGREHLRTLKLLLASGADPNIVTRLTSPVQLLLPIVQHGRYNEVRALLAAGADPVPRLTNVSTPLQSPLVTALVQNNLPLAKLLADGLFYTRQDIQFLAKHLRLGNVSSMDKALPPKQSNNLLQLNGKIINSYGSQYTLSASTLSLDCRDSQSQRQSPKSVQTRADDIRYFGSQYNLNASTVSLDCNANEIGSLLQKQKSGSPEVCLRNNPRNSPPPANNAFNDSMTADFGTKPTALSVASSALWKSLPKSLGNQEDKRSSFPENFGSCIDVEKQNVHEFIKDLCLGVPSLQKLCRRSVHRTLQPRANRAELVQRLPVWPALHRYILFEQPELPPIPMTFSRRPLRD